MATSRRVWPFEGCGQSANVESPVRPVRYVHNVGLSASRQPHKAAFTIDATKVSDIKRTRQFKLQEYLKWCPPYYTTNRLQSGTCVAIILNLFINAGNRWSFQL